VGGHKEAVRGAAHLQDPMEANNIDHVPIGWTHKIEERPFYARLDNPNMMKLIKRNRVTLESFGIIVSDAIL
jgi:hypothetical protein